MGLALAADVSPHHAYFMTWVHLPRVKDPLDLEATHILLVILADG
jgi:hypothetical protein